jgi:voltage-gated potassium channel
MATWCRSRRSAGMVAALVMICGLGVFGLWTGILATGFAAETRRDNFLKTWESVSKVPFFAALGPAAIADVTTCCAPWTCRRAP